MTDKEKRARCAAEVETMAALKRCPFCGSKRVRMEIYKGPNGCLIDMWVECLYCGSSGPRLNKTSEEAINRWNAEWARVVEEKVSLGD